MALSRFCSSRLVRTVSLAMQGASGCRPVQMSVVTVLSPSQVFRRVFSSMAVWRLPSSSSSTAGRRAA